MTSSEQMWQLVIEDPDDLSGASLSVLVQKLLQTTDAPVLRVGDIQGAGEGIVRLREAESRKEALRVSDFLNFASDILQIDWGDFFFFRSEQQATVFSTEEDYVNSVPKAELVLRAVDDTYFYVYGRDRGLLSLLRSEYPGAVVKYGEVGELEFPY